MGFTAIFFPFYFKSPCVLHVDRFDNFQLDISKGKGIVFIGLGLG